MQPSLATRIGAAMCAALLAALTIGTLPALAAAPSNDDWAAAAPIGALPATRHVNTSDATTQAGEPNSICTDTDFTVWYKLRLDQEAVVLLDLHGSAIESGVTVWKGSSLASLDEVACAYGTSGDPAGTRGRVSFRAKAGVRYYIQIVALFDEGTNDTHGGNVTLKVKRVTPPGNDDFQHATSVTSFPFHAVANNIKATSQPGEPAQGECLNTLATRWFKVHPSQTMTLRADTLGSPLDTVIAVFSGGPSLGALDYVACDDDTSSNSNYTFNSSVAWTARAGKTYWVQAGGFDNETGDIDVTIQRVHPPTNDNRGSARVIPNVTGSPFNHSTNTRNATWQPTETIPETCTGDGGVGGNSLLQTVWYRYTAPNTSPLKVTLSGAPGVSPVVVVYTGASFATDVQVVCDEAQLTFAPASGTTYYFQVAGKTGRSGPISFTLELAP